MKAEFAKYTLLKLYTDTVPAEYYSIEEIKTLAIDRQEDDARKNSEFQKSRFNDVQLPLYAIIEPTENDFRIVARYEYAVIDDKNHFVKFLQANVKTAE